MTNRIWVGRGGGAFFNTFTCARHMERNMSNLLLKAPALLLWFELGQMVRFDRSWVIFVKGPLKSALLYLALAASHAALGVRGAALLRCVLPPASIPD